MTFMGARCWRGRLCGPVAAVPGGGALPGSPNQVCRATSWAPTSSSGRKGRPPSGWSSGPR